MDWFVKAFLRSCLVWLGLGVTLGLAMALWPSLTAYRTAHLHLNLAGFVLQVIYGVALHVVPRFVGQPLRWPALAGAQWWLANVGTALLVAGFVSRVQGAALAAWLLGAGGVAAATAAYLFIAQVWTLLDARPMTAILAGRRSLETIQPNAH